MEATLYIFGGLIAVIAFFLRDFYSKNNATNTCVIELKTKVALLENNHSHLSESLNKLDASIVKLTDKIEHLTEIVNTK